MTDHGAPALAGAPTSARLARKGGPAPIVAVQPDRPGEPRCLAPARFDRPPTRYGIGLAMAGLLAVAGLCAAPAATLAAQQEATATQAAAGTTQAPPAQEAHGAAVRQAAMEQHDDPESVAAGKQVYERANCMGCHKWSGVGGGGYGGAALSLRETQLGHDEIVQIVTCGRPGTGMPHFTTDPYAADKKGACYNMDEADVHDMMPPAANVVLRPREIQAVADYVLAAIKGKGEPTLAQCIAFFNDTSRACDIYRPAGTSHHAMPTPSTVSQ